MPVKMTPRIGSLRPLATAITSAAKPNDRHGVDERRRLGEPEADPVVDRLIAAEAGRPYAVVDVGVDQRADDRRQHEQQPERTDQRRPTEQRHPSHVHARRPGGEHGRCQRPGGGGEAEQHDDVADEEQADELRVAAARPAVGGDRDDDEDRAAEPRPEAGGGQPGERQRPGAELQRHDGDARCRAAAGRARRT